MKNILLIASHLNSGSDSLVEVLNENERIDLTQNQLLYDHPIVLEALSRHKLDNAGAIYGGQVLFNKDFSSKSFYDFAKFIYFIRDAKSTLNSINTEYSEIGFSRYYCFRLRRIYEMAYNSPGSILLTWDDLTNGKGLDLIKNYLNLKSDLNPPVIRKESTHNFNSKLVETCQDCYEKYLYKMKNLNLRLAK